jgi:GT2 family glycosyltransferase
VSVSIVIPTYGRGQVLIDTVHSLLALPTTADEILVVDQTQNHEATVEAELAEWAASGTLRWIKQQPPGVVAAMNRGLREARNEIVLFLDDDIIPDDRLVEAHTRAHQDGPPCWAVAGQVLQPGQEAIADGGRSSTKGLRADLNFAFNSSERCELQNVMAGNLSVKKSRALAVGGFDEQYVPPVSFRFETDFARRVLAAGGKVLFEPGARIRHLAVAAGGTRISGGHMRSGSPVHGVGDYYFALCHGRGVERLLYMLRRPFREVRTKFHLTHPWWIPIKFVGECRAMARAISLYRNREKSA